MTIFRTALRGLGRTLAMPVTAPARQIARSASTIASDIEHLKLQRAARAAAIEAQARELRLDDLVLVDAGARFETVRAARGLTVADLDRQLRGLRRNRRIFAALAFVLTTAGVAWLAWAGASEAGLAALLAGLCLLLAGPMAAARAFLLGLFQHQIEHRRLDGAGVYLARRDLFSHWLGW